MPRFDLATLARQARPGSRKRSITLREIAPPAVLATDLYRTCYKPVIDVWKAALPRILDAYERSLSEMTLDSPADVNAEVESAANEATRLILLLTPRVREWALKVESFVRKAWTGTVKSSTGVDLTTILTTGDVTAPLEQHIQWNTDLIADVSGQVRQRVSNSVYSGLTERKPARDVAREINEATDLGRDRSQRIASDQLGKLSGSLAEQRQRDAGIEIVIWRHSRKLHPRARHAARDGKKYRLDGYKAVEGGEVVPPDDWVQRQPYCGCRTQAWIDLLDEL